MKVVKDEGRCVSSGHCCFIAPEVFELRDGVMRVITDVVPDANRESVEQAVAQCPAEALRLVP